MVVEDDKGLRHTLTATLRAEGYFPDEAGSVFAANERISENKPDLIVLDLGLPDGDGMTLLADLRGAGDLTPVIVLTARGDEESKVRALDLGADDYVTK
ncbi:MAG: response regulator, partial [Proteobacteria bacterium]|nr:response regulator [Pseudomonadota bacterium]